MIIKLWEGIVGLLRKKQSGGIVQCDQVHVKVFKNLDDDSCYITGHFNSRLVLNSTINKLTPLVCHGSKVLNFGLLNVAGGRKGFFCVYEFTFSDETTFTIFEGVICNIINGKFASKISYSLLLFLTVFLYYLYLLTGYPKVVEKVVDGAKGFFVGIAECNETEQVLPKQDRKGGSWYFLWRKEGGYVQKQ